jgi:hydroxymethylpyrimidine pyrophosphatase-like HAD family hydrolase
MKTIALDYDGTYTADPELWLAFIKNAHARGHKVVCVTMRHAPEIHEALFDPRLKELVTVYPTGREAKKKHMRMKGVQIDIWIDDNPEWIFEGSS